MTKNTAIWFILPLFLIISFSSRAQKVKYKDLFGLLSTKQYELAEPFLKRYLLDNDDNPNAFLYMGIIYQEKALKMDILKQTSRVTQLTDSAIHFYSIARTTINDRELRKNKEYYEAYNRRDLRTGEFGVKLSDIQFDIEKKIQALQEQKDKVRMVKYYFSLSDSLYKRSNSLFKSLQDMYPEERHLYLRSDETTLKQLNDLSLRFDSCARAFENYKTASTHIGRTGYNQTLTLLDMNDFSKDGSTGADFYKDDLKLWDYKKFADKAKTSIEKDIIPMRSHLVKYDVEINKLREKLNHDSVSVRSDLTRLIDVLLYEQLRKYDPEPLPMDIFSMKTADIEYRSSIIEHKELKDSSDINLRIRLLEDEMKYLHNLDSIANRLASADLDQRAPDYAYFINNTYGNTIVLHSYIKGMKEFAGREKKHKEDLLISLKESLNWVVDGNDSIPLDSLYDQGQFKPLHVVWNNYTLGISYKDTLHVHAYLYDITPSRKPGLKVKIPLDKASFGPSVSTTVKAKAYADPTSHFYYFLIYNEGNQTSMYPASLAKIYRSDGLAWNSNLTLGFIPDEMIFKPETSELIVKNNARMMIFDKNGKELK